ncbi:MAG TPA: autoantigen p27 domain-containing protein [Methanoregula sp.]|nr:autoantigen p27 domain-containing protein [Methanoregula sp.]
MAERKDDEIMAEYLLKGGKMLEKTCPECGCPLFEYKKKTFCVVCAEKKPTVPVPAAHVHPAPAAVGEAQRAPETLSPIPFKAPGASIPPEVEMLSRELSATILVLCQRIKKDEDPERCLAYMDAIKTGTDALVNLRQL